MGKNKIQINTSDNPAKEAGKYLNDLLAVHINDPLLLFIAGGSSKNVLEYISPESLGNNLTVTVTDERFTEDLEDNNFSALQATLFYDALIQVDAFCINTEVFLGDTLEMHKERFKKNIRDWQQEFPRGKIIALYGIGEDGHIGGIIPGIYKGKEFTDVFEGKDLIATVDTTTKGGKFIRATTTFSFMKLVDYPLLYVVGDNKKEALKKALAEEGTLEETPARIIQEMHKLEVFTDIPL